MEIIQEKNDLQLNGIAEKGEFQFKITPQAMQMFFKDIYKDPILACIRELVCNAYDAHTMNKNPQEPFAVHIPTELEPYFEVRDFGVGLSKNGMETLYSTFFESAKQHTNELIGGLGIGSKSPLAYTDMFTATSYFNGKMYQYLITKNELGVPTWNFVGEFDTDERNGLCINVPVKATHGKADYRDVEAFKKAAIKVLTRFAVRPIMTGARVDIPNVEYAVQYGTWGVRKDNTVQGLVAIMGNIAYPINIDSLRLDEAMIKSLRGIILAQSRYHWDRNDKTPMNIDINFDIGALSITPSREELQYDNRTVDTIMAAFKKVQEEFLAETKRTIEAKKTYFDAVKHVVEMSSGMRNVVTSNKMEYKGRLIETNWKLEIPTREVEVEVDEVVNGAFVKVKRKSNVKELTVERLDLDQMIQYKNFNHSFAIGASRYNGIEDFDATTMEPIVIVKNERIGNIIPKLFPYMRDKHWKGNKDRHIAVTNTGAVNTNRFIIGVIPSISLTDRKQIEAHIKTMMKKIGLDTATTIIFTSDLVEDASLKPVRNTASSNAGKAYRFRTLDLKAIFNGTKNVKDIISIAEKASAKFVEEDVEVKKSKGTLYTVTGTYSYPTWGRHNLVEPEMLVLMQLMGIEKVVSVPPQRLSNHIRENWVRLETFLEKESAIKKLTKHLKNTDTNMQVSWEKLKADVIHKNRTIPVLNYMDAQCGGLNNWPKLQLLNSWINLVEKAVHDNRNNFHNRLARYFSVEKEEGQADIAKFYQDTKHLGNVKAIVEDVVPMLSVIEVPDRYRWNSDQGKERAVSIKKVVDKLMQ